MMRALNVAAGWLVGALLRPVEAWPPIAGLALASAAAAALLLVLVRVTSNRRALGEARRQVQAGLLELRLFQDDPRLVLRALGDLVRQQGRYLRHALVPVLWASLPLALLIAHLQVQYGYERLAPGDTAIVTVRMRAGAMPADGPARPALALDVPPGIRLDSPGVWTPALREVAWRIRALRETDDVLRVRWHATAVTKRVCVTARAVACDAVRPAPGFWDEWRYPAEARLPADVPIDAIAVTYSARAVSVIGVGLPWLVVFFVLTGLFVGLGGPLLGRAR